MSVSRNQILVATEQLVKDFHNGVLPLDPFDDGWWHGWMRKRLECPHNDDDSKRYKWKAGRDLGREDRDKHDAEGSTYTKVVAARTILEDAGGQELETVSTAG